MGEFPLKVAQIKYLKVISKENIDLGVIETRQALKEVLEHIMVVITKINGEIKGEMDLVSFAQTFSIPLKNLRLDQEEINTQHILFLYEMIEVAEFQSILKEGNQIHPDCKM